MAYRRFKRRRPRRPAAKRRVSRRKRQVYARKTPLPPVQRGMFRYSEQLFSTATLGALSTYVFSANGMYDPDITGTGHQPRGFDQLMTMYDHYAVTACRIRIDVANAGTAAIVFGVCPLDTPTVRSNFNDYLEDRRAKWVNLSPINSGVMTKTLSHYVDVGRFLGRKVRYEDDLKGDASANPVDQVYWHVFMATIYSTDTTSISWIPTLDYTATLLEPKLPAQS